MGSSAVNFSDLPKGARVLNAPPAASPEYSDLPSGAKVLPTPSGATSPDPGFWSGVGDTLSREASSFGSTIAGIPGALYHGAADPASPDEIQRYGPDYMHKIGPAGRLIERMAVEPTENAIDWYRDAAQGKIPDPVGQALSVAPEAIGSAGAAVVTPRLAQKVAAVAPDAFNASVRGGARATNAALERAPGVIGGAAGAAIGHATGLPEGGTLGGIAGYQLGRTLLPKLRVPGENFGIATPDPALSSSARTLPGQISPEVIRPPAQPIPPRSGLLLSGDVAPEAEAPITLKQKVAASAPTEAEPYPRQPDAEPVTLKARVRASRSPSAAKVRQTIAEMAKASRRPAEEGSPEEWDALQQIEPQVENTPKPEEDLTDLLQQSLARVRAKKSSAQPSQ